MHLLTIWYVFALCVLVPWAGYKAHRRMLAGETASSSAATRPPITRSRVLVSALLTQVFFLLMSLGVTRIEGLALFPREWPAPLGVAAAALFLVVSVGSIPARWRHKTENELRRTDLLLPRTPRGLWLHALVCLLAGFVEELTYRGMLPALLAPRLGAGAPAWWLAQGISIGVFSLAHLVQGWRTTGVIALLTLGIVTVVALSGNLYAAMAAHTVYDFLAGVLWIHLRREKDGHLGVTGSAQ